MEQRVSLITLGVTDLQRAKTFYTALGWDGREVQETVFFQAGGLVVTLWDRDKLADDSAIADAAPGWGGVVLAHNVRSREEVEDVLAAAAGAGATITKPAEETFYGGYAGVFRDTEGHHWEIAHNPGFTLGEDGSVVSLGL